MHVRSGDAACARRTRRLRSCLTAGAGGSGAARVSRAEGSEDARAQLYPGPRAWQRAVLAQPRSGQSVSDSRSRITSGWCSRIRTGTGGRSTSRDPADYRGAREGRSEARADPERHQSRPARVPAARRQAAAVPRLERSADLAAEQHRLLRERALVLRRQQSSGSGEVQSFYRLFMAPGMAHCGGGPGPNTFDMQAALEQWVEHGIAPERIIATRAINGIVDRTRPLCPYPQVRSTKDRRYERRREFRVPRGVGSPIRDVPVLHVRRVDVSRRRPRSRIRVRTTSTFEVRTSQFEVQVAGFFSDLLVS